MGLLLFDEIKGLSDDRKHNKFKFLRDEIQLSTEKQLLCTYTNGLVDRDHKMVRQFQETFHSTYWEICIYQLCLEAGFSLDQSHPFPDFIIKKPSEFYIEAVVANIKQTGIPECERTLEDQLSMLTPPHLQKDFSDVLNESIIRSSNAIFSKIRKYEDYKKEQWVDEKKPFIIALSSCDQINYGREFIYPMMALLYGRYYIPCENGCIMKKNIRKSETGVELPLGIFLNSEYSQISAIMYTCTNTIGKLTALALSKGLHTFNSVLDVVRDEEDEKLPFKFRIVSNSSPESISDGVFIFHNPYAKEPIKLELFENTNVTHVFLENNSLALLGVTSPLYTRFSINSCMSQRLFNEIIASSAVSWNKITPDILNKINNEKL